MIRVMGGDMVGYATRHIASHDEGDGWDGIVMGSREQRRGKESFGGAASL